MEKKENMAKKSSSTANSFTPRVEQYISFKKKYGDRIIFFRIGDFYERFREDAELVSRELQLYLTKKACGNGKTIPRCGIPHHAYLSYAQKLIDHGHKVAIVEQVEDPKLAKKLVKRDVIQFITPGANLDPNIKDNIYIASLELSSAQAFLAYADITTGERKVLSRENQKERILERLLSLDVKELVLSTSFPADIVRYLKKNSQICISYYNDASVSIETDPLFGNLKDDRQIVPSARLYNYRKNREKRDLTYFKPVENLMAERNRKIDYSAQANRELTKSLDGKSYGTLYWLLDQTRTPRGSRYLKSEIISPSANETEITSRLNKTECFLDHFIEREKLREELSHVFDRERLIARMGYRNSNGHDLLQLKKSLQIIPRIKEILRTIKDCDDLEEIKDGLGDFSSLSDLLERSLDENCPLTITEGGIFKKGYNPQLDELIERTDNSKEWLTNFEAKEKEKTGIKNLKVGENSLNGFYIEVSTGSLPLVKPEFGYIRKQTLTTGERFITPELKEKESRFFRARESRQSLEYSLFKELRAKVSTYTDAIQKASTALAKLDYYLDLAYVASENNYVRPSFNGKRIIDVKEARHPIREKANPGSLFVANDYQRDQDTDVIIITGPNRGGKSTYRKEFGLLAIMAQRGSFVPAEKCDLPIFDALYTRIGASDNLIKGQSTFRRERSEVAEALSSATSDSLFLFDEIGRGTATFDGMAIAESIIEYLVAHVHAKTFFSTHYHELIKLSEKISAVKNIHCEVNEDNGNVTFLYKRKPGSRDKSYGVNVAKLAGLPDEITTRAASLLASFESRKNVEESQIKEVKKQVADNPIEEELKHLDPMSLSPLEALNYLIDLKKRIK